MTAATSSPVDFVRPGHSAKANFETALAERDGRTISLPTLYAYVIDRLEHVLERDWSVVHEREASYVEDMTLKLRLWASERGLTTYEGCTKQGCWLKTHDYLVAWAKDQLFEINASIGVLESHTHEIGYRPSSRSKGTNTDTKQMLATIGNLIETLTRQTTATLHRRSLSWTQTPNDTPSSSRTAEQEESTIHRWLSNSSTSPSSSTSFASRPSLGTASRSSYSTVLTTPDERDEELAPKKSEPNIDIPEILDEEEILPLQREVTANYINSDNIITICNTAHEDLATLLDTLNSLNQREPENDSPLNHLHEALPTLITYISTILTLHQPTHSFSTSNHEIHTLMRETHLAHMIRSLGEASKPVISKLRSSSTSPRPSIGSSRKSSIFDDIVLPSFAMHASVAERTFQLGLEACTALDTRDDDPEAYFHRSGWLRRYSKKLVRETEAKLVVLDGKVAQSWNERSHRMKNLQARDEVETHLTGMRACWEYLVLVCEWVLERTREVRSIGGGVGGDDENEEGYEDDGNEYSDDYDDDDDDDDDEFGFDDLDGGGEDGAGDEYDTIFTRLVSLKL